MMPGITQAMGATAILLSVVVRAIRSGASWQAIDDGVATQEHLRDVTGILNPETLQDIFGPPRLEDGVFRVTRAEVLRQRTGIGYLLGDRWLDGASAVVAIVVTGVVQGYRQLGSIDALRHTGYGRLLVIKTVIVAVVVLLAARSRSLVRAQVEERVLVASGGEEVHEDDDEDDEWRADPVDVRRSLRRAVAGEALIALAVLAVTSLLVSADPGRTITAEGFSAARVVQGTVIEAVAAPARTGPVDLHVYVSDPTIGLTTQLSAEATLSLPERGIRSVQVPLRPAGRGHWSAYDVDIPIKGSWRYQVVVTIGDFDSRRALFSIPVK